MAAYYNEFVTLNAAWLRELIKAGLICAGEVDERSIVDVKADELRGFTQCHFFAGIGGWSYALRLAGWPDDRPVWTGSPPCQPFSNAGKRNAQADARHLWPVFFNLIRECKPANIFGEQVEAAIRTGWLDDLQDDLETEGYATGKIVLPACGVGGGFHIRQRIWFVAERLADSNDTRPQRWAGVPSADELAIGSGSLDGGLGNPEHAGLHGVEMPGSPIKTSNGSEEGQSIPCEPTGTGSAVVSGALRFWRNPDWLYCRDGKWRPVESEVQRVVDGLSGELVRSCNISPACNPLAKEQEARVMRLKGYGNAIVPAVAAEVIKAYMDGKRD